MTKIKFDGFSSIFTPTLKGESRKIGLPCMPAGFRLRGQTDFPKIITDQIWSCTKRIYLKYKY